LPSILKEDAIASNVPLFVGLNDLRKAFPSFNRVKLLEDMVEAKVASKVVALLGHLY
jgi:hypothetical protein